MAGEWAFLIDECVDPSIATELNSERIRAEAVKDALWIGADDRKDVLPYARENDLIVITSDVSDYSGLDDDDHEGVIVIYDNELRADQIITGIRTIIDQYPSRDTLRGYEKLDSWISSR